MQSSPGTVAWLYILSVWLHVVAATAWIGSMLFFTAVLVPAMRDPALRVASPSLMRIIGRRYREFAWASLGVLLLTGVTNLYFRGLLSATLADSSFWSSAFGRTLRWKLVFVFFVFCTTSAHDVWTRTVATKAARDTRSSATAMKYRQCASLLGRATLFLSLVVLFFAVQLVRGSL